MYSGYLLSVGKYSKIIEIGQLIIIKEYVYEKCFTICFVIFRVIQYKL